MHFVEKQIACLCACARSCVYICVHAFVCVCALRVPVSACASQNIYAPVFPCFCARKRVCVRAFACMHACMRACVRAFVRACVRACGWVGVRVCACVIVWR